MEEERKFARELFLQNLSGIERDTKELIKYLDSTDFFDAPASSQYHNCYAGGLCQHSLNVYNKLVELNDVFNLNIKHDTLIIVGLLHDLGRADFYEKYFQNKKIYSKDGSKFDEQGKYDWKSIEAYKVKDASERYLAGSIGFNSYMKISNHLPLTDEEIITLCNYELVGRDSENVKDIGNLMTKYPLLIALHCAKLMTMYEHKEG